MRTAEEIAEAIEEVQQALEQSPDEAVLLKRLGNLHVQNRDLDAAVDVFVRILKQNPEDVEAQERLGDARIRRLELKIQDAEKSIQDGEEGGEDRIKRLKRELVNLQIEEFQRRVTLRPTDMGLRFRLGHAHLKDGNVDVAIEQFQQSVKDPKHRVSSLHLLGRAFFKKGIMDLAVKQLEQAADSLGGMSPQRKEILYELAQVCEHAGSTDKALATYKQIYEADISYKDVGPRIEALSS